MTQPDDDHAWRQHLAAHPDDDDLRRDYARWLRRREDPRGELLELDLELTKHESGADLYGERHLRLEALVRRVDPAWLLEIGERDGTRLRIAARVETMLTQWHLSVLVGHPVHLPGGAQQQAFRAGASLVRGLRRADAAALVAQHEWADVLTHRLVHESASRLWALRALLPNPVDEFTATLARVGPGVPLTTRRAAPHQLDVHLLVDASQSIRRARLVEAGPRRVEVMNALRNPRDELLAPALALAELARRVRAGDFVFFETYDPDDLRQVTAAELVDDLQALGATVEIDAFGDSVGDTHLTMHNLVVGDAAVVVAGDPRLVALHDDGEHLSVLAVSFAWTHPHHGEWRFEVRHRWPIDALPTDPAEHIALLRPAIDAVIAERRATFQTCDVCSRLTPPEWWHGERDGRRYCGGCAEDELGVVH